MVHFKCCGVPKGSLLGLVLYTEEKKCSQGFHKALIFEDGVCVEGFFMERKERTFWNGKRYQGGLYLGVNVSRSNERLNSSNALLY